MEMIWYAFAAAACLVALGNWRAGIYVGVLVDCLRDPVRKISEDQSVLITVSGAMVWGCVLLRALLEHQNEIRTLLQRYPRLKTVGYCMLAAIIPAALLSCILYRGGWKLAAIGSASYLVPLLGIAVGYFFARSEREVYRLMTVYSVLNGIQLIGVPLELWEYDIPGLGGIKMDWVRYRPGYTVDLIAGFYRSPDIMGLHAAHVVMFSSLLAIRSRTASRLGWVANAVWAASCVLLSGRRKMIGIPLVFLCAYIGIAYWRGMAQFHRVAGVAAMAGLIVLAAMSVLWDRGVGTEYADYAGTIFTEGAGRANELIVTSSVSTLQQVGILGAGLGTATQGRGYVAVRSSRAARGWQEDGISRLILEFGIPGIILLIVAAICLVLSLMHAIRLVPPNTSVQLLQIGLLSVVIGDLASATISHQQFSGDPVSGILLTMLAGMTLGAPRIFAMGRHGSNPRMPAAAPGPVDAETAPLLTTS